MNNKLKYFLRDYVTYRALYHSDMKCYGLSALTFFNTLDMNSKRDLKTMHENSNIALLSIMRNEHKNEVIRAYSKVLLGIGIE